MRPWFTLAGVLILLQASSICVSLPAVQGEDATLAGDKRALGALQSYVGSWRGVAQPKRGSNQGAWTEALEWSWRFEAGRAALSASLDRDRYYTRLRVTPEAQAGRFVVEGEPSEASAGVKPQRFTGSLVDGALVVADSQAPADRPARISIRLVADSDRMVMLYEKRLGEDSYARLLEVGSTREGSNFAKNAASGPECVVTGGLGKIAVEHMGKKYFVCCSGCRDLFNEDPEGVLAEYRARKAAEAHEKK